MLLALSLNLWLPAPSHADATKPRCYEQVDLNTVEVICEYDGKTLEAARAADPTATWVVYQLCKDGTSGGPEACANPRICTVDGRTGTFYAVIKNGKRDGLACLTASEATAADKPPIRSVVIQTFKTLDWSPSAVNVQPPGGKTLVNLDTNFFTTNTDATSIPVTLQGQNIVVTARPIAYRWHFDDATSITTTSPGAPYPNLDVAHVYEQTGDVAVSVDTQYGDASFTVNGGPSEAIPSTIWVAGESQDLEIVEAMPQLVIR